MIPFLMRKKNESSVYFEKTIDLSKTLPWLDQENRERKARGPSDRATRPITVFHLLLGALARVLHERPRLNRFVAGRRIYQRNDVFISFAAKKQFDDDAPLAVVKRKFAPSETFAEMVAELLGDIDTARSDEESRVDIEMDVLLKLPAPIVGGAVRLLQALDAVGLAPAALIDSDPMYTSVFVANLGSLKIDAAYHHLYEHGNCPLFVTLGIIEDAPVAGEGGTVEVRPQVTLRFTFDERIEDGHYCARSLERLQAMLEDPGSWIGATSHRSIPVAPAAGADARS